MGLNYTQSNVVAIHGSEILRPLLQTKKDDPTYDEIQIVIKLSVQHHMEEGEELSIGYNFMCSAMPTFFKCPVKDFINPTSAPHEKTCSLIRGPWSITIAH